MATPCRLLWLCRATLCSRHPVDALLFPSVCGSIGAWSSPQSTPIESRDHLAKLVADSTSRFADTPDHALPRPEFWGGYIVTPRTVEFWRSGGASRLHDRVVYKRDSSSATGWTLLRLAP